MSPWNPSPELHEREHLRLEWTDHGRSGCINFATSTITMRRWDALR